MIRYSPPDLSETTRDALSQLSSMVTLRPNRKTRSVTATRLFSAKRPASAFAEIRLALASVAPHVEACYYCERDRHRDIDHIYPKSLWPELAFDWENYAYACAICNQDAKRAKFAVVSDGGVITDCAKYKDTNDNIPEMQAAFINPRHESGLDFFDLDLETGILVTKNGLDQKNAARANYTRMVLDLNADVLLRTRRNAFQNFRRYVEELSGAVRRGDSDLIGRLSDEVVELSHPTVMVEAWRQRRSLGRFGATLSNLYEYVGLDRWHGAERDAA